MEDSCRPSNIRNFAFMGKQSLIPPRSPAQCIYPSISVCIPGSAPESHDLSKPKGGHLYHHRASSDALCIEEQPAWLDDLLSEPESPAKSKGHRRAASDTAAYLNKALMSFGEDNKPRCHFVRTSWLFQSIDHHDDMWRSNSYNKHQDRGWEPPTKNANNLQKPGSSSAVNKVGTLASKSAIKKVREGKEGSPTKLEGPAPKNDSKHVKQQNAHRARVRRLQYISELERNIQMLQSEGSDMASAIHYFDQQLIMLSMENRALKQHLDSLAQIQKLKQMEQDMLERELGRLRILHHQQQQQQQPMQLMRQNQYT